MLRSLFISVALFLLGSVPALAQSVTVSITPTASLSWFDLDEPLGGWSDNGLAFPGLWIQASVPMAFIGGPLAERLSLETGLRYNRLAAQVDWENVIGNPAQTYRGFFQIRQHVASIPVLAKVRLGTTPVSLMGGLDVGFLVGATKVSETEVPTEARSSMKRDVLDDIRRAQLSLMAGIGFRVASSIELVLLYGAGTASNKKNAEAAVLVTDWQTRHAALGVRYQLGVKR